MLNAAIIQNGYATPMTIPPNVKHADLFKELYEEARLNKRGLWGMSKDYEDIGCPDSVKLCPDGSFLYRGGLNCDFGLCPK